MEQTENSTLEEETSLHSPEIQLLTYSSSIWALRSWEVSPLPWFVPVSQSQENEGWYHLYETSLSFCHLCIHKMKSDTYFYGSLYIFFVSLKKVFQKLDLFLSSGRKRDKGFLFTDFETSLFWGRNWVGTIHSSITDDGNRCSFWNAVFEKNQNYE